MLRNASSIARIRRIRRWARWVLSGGGIFGVWTGLAGCAAMAVAGAGAAVYLLTGVFLGRVQASFAATARSYQFEERGDSRVRFGGNPYSNILLTDFQGRLPGFHLVFINIDNDKAISAAQADDAPLYNTDVGIDFEAVPPTLVGTITSEDGSETHTLAELYPTVGPVSVSLSDIDSDGRVSVRFTIEAESAEGDQLEYSLIWHAQLGSAGVSLDGDVEIERVLTTQAGEEISVTGTGSMNTVKQ